MAKQEQPAKSRFGAQLRAWRKERRMSQDDLALACEMNRGHISLLERGYWHPSDKTLEKFAHGLGLDVADIRAVAEESKADYSRDALTDLSDTDTFAVTSYLPQEVKRWYKLQAKRRNVSISQLVGSMLLKRYYESSEASHG